MNDTGARHPNRFLTDLTQAMHSAARTARQATIDQCQADAKAYTEQLHGRTNDVAASLRKAAEDDVIAIGDWSKVEVERIRVETEQRISQRRDLFEQELQEYNAAIELEIERVQQRVQAFQAEVDQFFEQLIQEADPSTFASMAAQFPDSPTFVDVDRGHQATDIPALREQIMRPDGMDEVENGGASMAPEAAAPDQPEVVDEAVASRTGRHGAGAAKQPVGPESTQVVVVGLVSVASIVAFKRQLSRLPGVKSVGVSSGPDGEFVFTVGHSPETSLGSLIPTLPAFQARVVDEREGVLNVSASDPEAEG